MARARITKRVVDGLKGRDGEYFCWDPELVGFGVRVQPSGAKSYIVKYRVGTGRTAPTRRNRHQAPTYQSRESPAIRSCIS